MDNKISTDIHQLTVVMINTDPTTDIETVLSFPGFFIDAGQVY